MGDRLDAASFLIAAACMVPVTVAARPASGTASMLADLRAGWSYFRSLPWIWSVTIGFTVINAIQMGVWQVLGPVIARASFGATGWGVVLSVRSVGLLVLSAALLRWPLRGRSLSIGLGAVALGGLPLALLGLHAPVVWLAAAAFIGGAGSALFGIVWDTTLQTHIPNAYLSRVTSYDDFGSYLAIPVGQLSVVPIAGLVGVTAVAVGGGIAYALAALLPLLFAPVRRLTAIPPPAAAADHPAEVAAPRG